MDYVRRMARYRPLPISEHRAFLEGEPYNVMVEMLDPDGVAVLNLDTDQIDSIQPSMEAFNVRFTPAPEQA